MDFESINNKIILSYNKFTQKRLVVDEIKKNNYWYYIIDNCRIPINRQNEFSDIALVYAVVFPDSSPICRYGHAHKFDKPVYGFQKCKRGSGCPTVKDTYTGDVWKNKAKNAYKKRTKTVQKKYKVSNIGQSKNAIQGRGHYINDKVRFQKGINKQKETLAAKTKEEIEASNNIRRQTIELEHGPGIINISQVKSAQDNKKATNKEKWGTAEYFSSNDFKVKYKKIMNEQGVEHNSQLHLTSDALAILHNSILLKEMLLKYGFSETADILGVADWTIYSAHKKFNLGLLSYSKSSHEVEIAAWLKDLHINFTQGDRKICKPNELDFLISNHKLAIEFDGLYWHHEHEEAKGKEYHILKTSQCNNVGIELIHIFEDEWMNNKDICKSIIKQKLSISTNKIAARKCQIKEIPNRDLRLFLDNNHLQGFSPGSIAIALKYNNEIVQVMTFGKPRYNKQCQYELIRLCTKIDIQIIGGTNRLWAYFLKTYNPTSIVSYCDKRWFTGSVYEKLNFNRDKVAEPTYWYVERKFTVRSHRSKYTKEKCVAAALALSDNIYSKEYLDSLSEEIITKEILQVHRIWDCGQDTWIWKNVD